MNTNIFNSAMEEIGNNWMEFTIYWEESAYKETMDGKLYVKRPKFDDFMDWIKNKYCDKKNEIIIKKDKRKEVLDEIMKEIEYGDIFLCKENGCKKSVEEFIIHLLKK